MKKILLSLFTFSIFIFTTSALPGINSFIQDKSGEYVYYRDKSFTRESYIGFLTYDDTTYAARYYAPAENGLPPKNLEFLFTLDDKKSYIDISGERFITTPLQEDTAIVNYIHDLVFELGKRRLRIGEISPNVKKDKNLNPSVRYVESSELMNCGFVSSEDFFQFGGDVKIYYDYLVPIFNVKKIENLTDSVFEVVAIGTISSSEDKSFSQFIPYKSEKENSATHKLKYKPGTKSALIQFGEASIKLDANWEPAGNIKNYYFCGSSAMLGMGNIAKENYYFYLKLALSSSQESFIPWNKISILENSDRVDIYSSIYNSASNNKRIISFLVNKKEVIPMLSLTVSENDYNSEKKYYQGILKTWK